MKKYFDIESGNTVTEAQLMSEYRAKLAAQPGEYRNMSFDQYLNNSMTAHNGTLEEVREGELKRYTVSIVQHAVIYFEVDVEAHSAEEAEEIFSQNNDNCKYEKEWCDAVDYAQITSEEMTIEEA